MLTSESPPALILDAWRRGRFELVASDKLLAELADVLGRPKIAVRISGEDRLEVLDLLREEADVRPDPAVPEPLTEDPDDDYLAALAIAADARYLVTGDRALTRWRSDVVRVVNPRTFLAELAESE